MALLCRQFLEWIAVGKTAVVRSTLLLHLHLQRFCGIRRRVVSCMGCSCVSPQLSHPHLLRGRVRSRLSRIAASVMIMRFSKPSPRRRRICHCPWGYVSRRTSSRPCMSPDHFFPITHFSLVLHNHATAATKRFHTVGAEAPFQVVESSYAGSVDCGENPCCRVSIDCPNLLCVRFAYIETHKQRP